MPEGRAKWSWVLRSIGCDLSPESNMVKRSSVKSKLLVVLGGLIVSIVGAFAQSSTFTYQGQLTAGGTPVTGHFDLRFALYNAANAGSQVGSTIVVVPVGVTNGLFSVELTFGVTSFDGSARWLEIGVRTNGSASAYDILTPRQALNATPY